eukprot:15440774-Alexandrium_andersonii.AAC.1
MGLLSAPRCLLLVGQELPLNAAQPLEPESAQRTGARAQKGTQRGAPQNAESRTPTGTARWQRRWRRS